jgi:hypothetical protein
MTPSIRKLLLTAHITLSVGWFGAVAAFLALAIVGLTSREVSGGFVEVSWTRFREGFVDT